MRSITARSLRRLALYAALASLITTVSSVAAGAEGAHGHVSTSSAPGATRTAATKAPFPNRVATYNLFNPGPAGPIDHASVIATYRPQVIGLQEMCVSSVRVMLDELAQAYGLHYKVRYNTYVNSHLRCGRGRAFGDALLTAGPIISDTRGRYTQGGTEPRGWVEVTTLVDGQEVRVFNTHLAQAGQSAIRASEVRELVAVAGTSKPTIVLGDFNAEPGTPEMAPMWGSFREADRGCAPPAFACKVTADASPHRKKFDYIFLSRDIDPPGNGVHGTATSDHDLVHADITMPFVPPVPEGPGRPIDLPPSVHAGPDRHGAEGSALTLQGSASDDHGAPEVHWSYRAGADVDAGASCGFTHPHAAESGFSCTDDGTYTVTLTANDGSNPPVSDSAVVRLRNVPPRLHLTGPKPWSAYRAGRAVKIRATFTDPGSNDTHTCRASWDEGGRGADIFRPAQDSCTRTHTFARAGMYTTRMRVTDDDGGSDERALLLIAYEPTAGLAVGAGSFHSPAHAFAGEPRPEMARFLALAKYLGADDTTPAGALSFALDESALQLTATRLDWLVITPDGKAAIKGTGTVNGETDYGFVAYLASGHVRTVIWPTSQGSYPSGTPRYDNKRGASYDIDAARPQPISSGSTVVDHGWIPGVPALNGDVLATVHRYLDLMPKTVGIDLRL